MKKLILAAVLFVVSTINLSVFGQTYAKFKSFDNTVMFQRTSEIKATLKFENVNGYIVTEYLTCTAGDGNTATYTNKDGSYAILTTTPWNFSGITSYEIDYYNSLGRRLWSSRISVSK